MTPTIKSVVLDAVALLAGATTGILTILLWIVGPRLIDLVSGRHERDFLVPTDMFVWMVGHLGALYAGACLVLAVLGWLVLRQWRLAGWVSAAILGFAVGEACIPLSGQGANALGIMMVGTAGLMAGQATYAARNLLRLVG